MKNLYQQFHSLKKRYSPDYRTWEKFSIYLNDDNRPTNLLMLGHACLAPISRHLSRLAAKYAPYTQPAPRHLLSPCQKHCAGYRGCMQHRHITRDPCVGDNLPPGMNLRADQTHTMELQQRDVYPTHSSKKAWVWVNLIEQTYDSEAGEHVGIGMNGSKVVQ